MLLDMLRQTPSNSTAAPPNNYPFSSHTPPQRSLSVNETRSFHIPPMRNTFTHTSIPEYSGTSFEIRNPQLSRTHALDASIASISSLSTFTEGSNHKRI